MSNKLKLDIISQESQLLSQEVSLVLAPTTSGQIGILPGHISLFTYLEAGELILVTGTKYEVFAVTGGFLDINQDQVTVLADSVTRAEDIDIAKVEEARKRAEETMKKQLSENDFKVVEADMRRAILELKVAKRRHRHQVSL